MEYVLQTNEVSKDFSDKLAVDHVSIKVNRGDVYGFIGENGAGKTTLMRMVCGLAAPTGGDIKLFGSGELVTQRNKVGCTIENPALYPAMTAMENMEAQGLLLDVKDKKVYTKLLDMAGISGTGKKKARDFSLGMKQRLMIALSLLGDPEFLVLDEPTNGLDPMGIKEVRDFIGRLNKEKGITVLVSSHILGDLEKLATRYGVISSGKMVDEFQSNELAARCGKNLVIHADDIGKTEEIVRGLFSGAQVERTPERTLRVKGHVEDAGEINTRLVQAGITVNALIPEGDKLEDYFLKLMGGHLGMILPQALLTIAYTALFTFISTTMRSNGGAIAVNVICVTMAGTLLSAISMLLGGKIHLDSYWLGGAVEKLATVTPASGDIVKGVIIAVCWCLAATVAGIALFRKQDVK